MSNEHKLHRDVNRAAQAEALIHNEMLQDAFVGLDTDYVKAWRETSARDTDARERLWQAVQVVGKVRDHLTKFIVDGKLAQRQIDDLVEKKSRLAKFGL